MMKIEHILDDPELTPEERRLLLEEWLSGVLPALQRIVDASEDAAASMKNVAEAISRLRTTLRNV